MDLSIRIVLCGNTCDIGIIQMLDLNVQKIFLQNKASGVRPVNFTQLAALMDISYKHLRYLINRGRQDDVERIAEALRISPNQLTSKDTRFFGGSVSENFRTIG